MFRFVWLGRKYGKRMEMEEIGKKKKKNCMVGNMGGKKTWWGAVVFRSGPQKIFSLNWREIQKENMRLCHFRH
jgi:hypothetical protein